MDFKELLEKDIDDLKAMLAEKQVLLRELRFKAREGQLKKVDSISSIRAEIAQLSTAIKQLS